MPKLGIQESRTSYKINRTFIHDIQSEDGGSSSAATAAVHDLNSRYKNPQRCGQWQVGSSGARASASTVDSRPKSLEEHGGEMKRCQKRRDLAGVLRAFGGIVRDGLQPDTYCYTILISTCANLGSLEDAELYWTRMKDDGVEPNSITFNTMLHACAKAKKIERAVALFEEMTSSGYPVGVVTYNLIINAFLQAGDFEKGCQWFEKMERNGLQPEAITLGVFINAYAQQGKTREAHHWYEKKINSGLSEEDKNVDIGMMMNAHANAGDVEGALHWHRELKTLKDEGTPLAVYEFTPLLKACGRANNTERAVEIFTEQIRQNVKPDKFNICTLFNVLGKTRGMSLCQELNVDISGTYIDHDAVSEALNFDPKILNRPVWRIQGYNTNAENLDGLCRKSFA